MGPTLTIPKRITHGEELLVVRRREYEQLQKHLVEVRDALAKIRQGDKELKEGKTRVLPQTSCSHSRFSHEKR